MSGRQTRPGKMGDNNTLPRHKRPPRTVPPSKSPTQPIFPDRSALPIQDTSHHSALHRQKHPPNPGKTRKIHPARSIGRVIRLLEGDFAQTGRVVMSGRQTRTGKTRANNPLHRQNHPPRTVPPSKSPTQPIFPDRSALPIQESSPNNGAFTKTRRAIRLLEGNSASGR